MVRLLEIGLKMLSTVEALCVLGSAVHRVSGRCALRRLLSRRSASRLGRPVTYASAFSGVDTVAAALDDILGAEGWRHEFLAEINPKVRAAATAAWTTRGLDPGRAHHDARDLGGEAWVELFGLTGECVEFSPKQHSPSSVRRARALRDINLALDYVRKHKPHLVLIENVDTDAVTIPLSGVLGEMPEYEWERLPICPHRHLGWPVRRWRSFWLGCLRGI